MLPDHLLPIKVILPRKELDYRRDDTGGGSTTLFCDVTPELRRGFGESVDKIKTYFSSSFRSQPAIPAVAKVALRPNAAAKSHRPDSLFNEQTCPIIGGDVVGEMLVSVTERGLARLKADIQRGDTIQLKANISTLQAIEPFSKEDVLDDETAEHLAREAAKTSAPLRVRLFRHGYPEVDAAIDQMVLRIAADHHVKLYERLNYDDNVSVLALRGASARAVAALSGFVGVQSVGLFPQYQIVRTASRIIGPIDHSRFPAPVLELKDAVVGIIDTGTDPKNAALQKHVIERYEWVKPTDQDNDHGSFVAGLIANARPLNHGNPLFPSVGARIVDVVALDKNGSISEYDLLTVIDDAVTRFPQVRVWNLSLGQTGSNCKDGRFSLLGLKLNSIAKKRNVLFVIAAGNYAARPFRDWRPSVALGETDRICPPADAIRGITVGSMAHLANASTRVGVHEPSPFTRRGPAPHYYLKPEISHYGGNCDRNGSFVQTGVVSVTGPGQLAENIGTSFAAPSVSALAANMFRELSADDKLSPVLVKAAIVHSAFVRSGRPDKEEVRYRGFGSPGDLFDILNCTNSSATVVFHAELEDRILYEKQKFPMPKCLQLAGGGLNAEVFMTLAYDPPTDGRYGVEYCRSNVTASLGTLKRDAKTGKEKYTPQLKPAPVGATHGLEQKLVQEGFKWSPLKMYYRRFHRGPVNARWRLHMEILNRLGVRCREPQKVVLIVTIRDPDGIAPVYHNLVEDMNQLAWGPQDLQIQSRVRAKRSRN